MPLISMGCSPLISPPAADCVASDREIPRIGHKGYSGSPAADTFPCRDGWLAIGANTPAHVARLMEVLGDGDAQAMTPGLGWRISTVAAALISRPATACV